METHNRIDFETTDLAEAERFLGEAYSNVQSLKPTTDEPVRLCMQRHELGPFCLDDVQIDFGLRFRVDPLHKLCLVHVRKGGLARYGAEGRTVYGPGDVLSMGAPDQSIAGDLHLALLDVVLFEEAALGRVAQVPPGSAHAMVRLTDDRPVSASAAKYFADTVGFVRERLLSNPYVVDNPLILASAAQHLAVTVLHTFPNNALLDPTTGDRRDSTPALLRRARTFIDDNAHRPLVLGDVAAAVHVTPRALQYMFRKHMDCTPMEYVRRVRLDRAHHDLLTADRGLVTVAHVAAKWGFAHTGRFAVAYRRIYGRSPHVTLRSG